MQKIKKSALSALRKNSGSSIVLVMISMFFISILGATAMYMAYTGMMMKVVDRHGQNTFYDADSALSQVETLLQEAITDSIALAYEETLVDYSAITTGSSGTDLESQFHTNFRRQILGWEWNNQKFTTSISTDVQSVSAKVMAHYLAGILGSSNVSSIDPEKLTDTENRYWGGASNDDDYTWATITTTDGSVYRIQSGIIDQLVVSEDGASENFEIYDISIEHTDGTTGYVSKVATDVSIEMPPFTGAVTVTTSATIPEYVLVAKNELEGGVGTTLTVNGSAYASSMTNGTLNVNKGQTIFSGQIDVGQNQEVVVSDSAAIWAEDIMLNGIDATLELDSGSSAYIADDLELGSQTVANIGGRYFGFGNSSTSAESSSAIVVNGTNAEFHRTAEDTFMLAGYSFVDDFDDLTNDYETLMGESLSVRSNQQAYLIPSAHLTGSVSNPSILNRTETAPSPALIETTQLWTIEGDTKTYADYGLDSSDIIRIPVHLSGDQRAYYFFLDFPNADDATAYFGDYFEVNKGTLGEYANNYLDLDSSTTDFSGIDIDANIMAASNVLAIDVDGDLALANNLKEPTSIPTQLNKTYGALVTTLSTVTASGNNPYDYYVKDSEVVRDADASGLEFRLDTNSDGVISATGGDNVVALIVDNVGGSAYNISSAPATVSLIIATGDVNIDDNFTGLIIAGGKATVSGSPILTADSEEVLKALGAQHMEVRSSADYTNGNNVIDYLNLVNSTSDPLLSGAQDAWAPGTLISFENWTKY